MNKDTSMAWKPFVDFHTHVLPEMDDGSSSVQESAWLLSKQGELGLGAVIATPHFYPMEHSLEDFLERREASCALLRSVYDPAIHPTVYLGAEVAFFTGIGHSRLVEQLTIVGTNVILVEMPFSAWTKQEVDDLISLRESKGMIPVVAHVERYARFQKRGTLDRLLAHGVLFQSNADCFLNRKTAKKALKQFVSGEIALLGSDCHNSTTRTPNLGNALAYIAENSDANALEQMRLLQDFLLQDATPIEF